MADRMRVTSLIGDTQELQGPAARPLPNPFGGGCGVGHPFRPRVLNCRRRRAFVCTGGWGRGVPSPPPPPLGWGGGGGGCPGGGPFFFPPFPWGGPSHPPP